MRFCGRAGKKEGFRGQKKGGEDRIEPNKHCTEKQEKHLLQTRYPGLLTNSTCNQARMKFFGVSLNLLLKTKAEVEPGAQGTVVLIIRKGASISR